MANDIIIPRRTTGVRLILFVMAGMMVGCGKPTCHDQYARFKRGEMSFSEGRELRLYDNDSLTYEQRCELWKAFKYPMEIDLSLGYDTVFVDSQNAKKWNTITLTPCDTIAPKGE